MNEDKNEMELKEAEHQMLYAAYLAGWHAAIAETIKVLMKLQVNNPRTPYDKECQ